uniref:AsmA-like C-terminal domain-containing protein n=1 Tax=Candidatus Desulfatibia profunda TaxID=2841695 RepID=A0A8J6TIK1_9BACT|nr:AsmA-like C-terminal domain-containing protein [Candidatus Desulfatibia profunda]
MTNLKKKFLWITGALVVLVIFLSTLILLSDRFINQESIINRIQTEMSRVLGGQVEFQRLEFSVFPQVRLVIHQCSFSIPETARGTLASLTIYPKVLPLFTGKLQIAAIDLNAPEIEIRRGKKRAPTDKNLHSFSVGVVQKKVEPVLRFVSSKAPGLILALANGRLKFVEEELVVKAKRFKGTIYRAEDKLTLALDELKLDYPRLDLSGKFDIRQPSPATSRTIELELKALDVDVASTRRAALALAGDIPAVQAIFKIVKGGRLPDFNFAAHGDTINDLGELDNIAVKGSMRDGEIFVPEVDFDLKDVKGDVTISKGILQAKELEARLGSIFARSGTLKLGLAGENALFHLNLPVEADLAELPSILKHVVGDTAFMKELALVENLQGKAAGSIILGEHLASIETNVEVAEFNVSASYRRLPYPLKLNSGRFSYKKDIIALKNVSGSMGKSSFSGAFLQFDLKKTSGLEIKFGKSSFAMEELFPWLSSFTAIKDKFQQLKTIKGTFSLAAFSFRGPPSEPENWHFQTAGSVNNLNITSPLFPDTLEVAAGQFNITTKAISFTDFQANLLDASLTVSGDINGYLKGVQNLDLKFHGNMGPNAARWTSDVIKFPPQLDLRPPISISAANLTWNNRRETTLSGDLTWPQGLKLSADIFVKPDQLTIKKLVIQDSESHATVKLISANRAFDLSFSGNLNKSTLDHLMAQNRFLGGWIKGDFHTHVLLGQPVGSTVQGGLCVKDLVFPWKQTMPVTINTLSLDAQGDNLHVESASLWLAENRFDLKGNLKFDPKGFLLDMEVCADGLNLDNLKQTLDQNITKNHDQADKSLWALHGTLKLKTEKLTYAGYTWSPFHADISFSDKSATVTVSEANVCGIGTHGILTLSPQKINLDVKPAAQNQALHSTIYCLADKAVKVDGNFNLEGNITAQGTDEALLGSLNGNLEFAATAGRFYAGIFHSTLMDIFNLLNLTEVFRGKLPDITKKGFGYNSIQAKADIQHGKLTLNEMIIDGISMNIVGQGSVDLTNKQVDCVALVAPFKAVDFFIKKIPVVKDILGGSLISIPVGIKGPLENPSVTPLSPSAVGSGLLGIMKRTLRLPVQVVQPIFTEGQKK